MLRPLLVLHFEVELRKAEAPMEQTTGGCRQPVDPAEAFVVGTHRDRRALHLVAEVELGPDQAQAFLLGARIIALLGLHSAAVEPHGFQLALWLLVELIATQVGVARIDVA